MQVVIADAGPLIGLARINHLDLLCSLFRSVWITNVIADELYCNPESGSRKLISSVLHRYASGELDDATSA